MDEDKSSFVASKKPNPCTDEISGKFYHSANLSSAPIQINVPINPSLETIGALCELETAETSRGSTDNEDGNSTDDRPPDRLLCLEDLIQLEHNYAAIFINTLERNENEESMEVCENNTSSPIKQSIFILESKMSSITENNCKSISEIKSATTSDRKTAPTTESKTASTTESKTASTTESKIASTTENETASTTDRKSAPVSESKSAPVSESRSAPSSEGKSAPISESKSAPVSESKSAPLSESKSAPLSESKSAPLSESKSAPLSESKSAPLSESKSAPLSESKTASTTESKTAPVSETKSGPVSESKCGPISESKSGPISESKSALSSESKSASVSESKSASVCESKSASVSESKSASVSENKSVPVSENKSTPVSENKSTPVSENKSTPVSENKSAPLSESKTASTNESKSIPISESKSAPLSESKSSSISGNMSAVTSENKTASAPVKVVAQLIKSSIPMEVLTSKLSPVRRSKRQIEKQERELMGKEVGDAFQVEVKTPPEIKEQSNSSMTICDLSSDSEKNTEFKSYCSNYKSFADFKKRHLKIIIEDCRYSQNLESKSLSDMTSNALQKTACNSGNSENKGESVVDKEEGSGTSMKKNVFSRTKLTKNKSVEEITTNIPLFKKRKILKADSEKKHLSSKKFDKNANMDVIPNSAKHKFSKKSIDSEHKQNEMNVSCKKQKHSTISDKTGLPVVGVNKRKKTVSFSNDFILHDKPEIPEKKQAIIDCKIPPQKSTSPIISPKSQKKKVARRESFRLVVNDDEPPLFSQPDVMIKVKTDDAVKKDEKESEQNLPNQDFDTKNQIFSSLIEENNSTDKSTEGNSIDKLSESNSAEKPPESNRTDKPPESNRTDKPPENNRTDKPSESSSADKQPESSSADKQPESNCTDKPPESNCTDKPPESNCTDKPPESNCTDKPPESNITDKPPESNCTDKPPESNITDKPPESNITDKPPECNSTDKPSVSNSTEKPIVTAVNHKSIKDSTNHYQQPSNVSQPIEIIESQGEHSDFTSNLLIKAETICEDEYKAVNDLNINNNVTEDNSSDVTNKLSIDYIKKKNILENVSEHDCNDDNKNVGVIMNIDKSANVSDEEKFTPERKSRRIIKKKEFFEDTLDVAGSKNSLKQQDVKSKVEKEITGVRKLTSRSRHSNMVKEGGEKSENVYSDVDSDESEEDDPDKLWCICRKPHNARFMIQCDNCEDWFHGSCVGVTKLFGRQLEKLKKEWWCPNCHVPDASVPQKAVKVLKDPIVEKGLEKEHQENDKDIKLGDMNGLQKMNTPTNNTNLRESTIEPQKSTIEPQKSTTKTKECINKPKESSLKSTDFGKDKKNSDASLTDSKSTKNVNSFDHIKKINKNANLKASETAPQKKTAQIKVSDSLKSHTKKKSVMLSKPVTQHKLLSTSPQTQLVNLSQSTHPTKNVSPKNNQRNITKQTNVITCNKRGSSQSKEKGAVVKKKQTCIQCQSEAKVNSCYCNDSCIDKYVTQCLKSMRETKVTSKGGDFDSQRLVVFDRMKGSVITNGPTSKEIVSWLKANPSYMIVFTPSTKKETISQKKECDSSTGTEKKDATDEAAKATVRVNVKKTLKNILMDRCKNADDIQLLEDDVQRIANKIEEELHSLFKDNSFKYRAKYRSLMFNIKDPRNQGLFRKILKGNIPPDRLVRMSSEELASIELAKWREQENQHLLDLIKREQLEHQKTGSGLLLKKTHKGEVEIEDDLTSIIEQDVPKVISKDIAEELVESENEVKNTTHLHRSHLFDLNCKICTGKIVPPPVAESISKRVRVAHSISVDNHSPSDSVERSVSRIVEGKSPVSSTGEDSMDQVPTSTVSIGSPEITVKPSSKNYPSKSATSVWKGFIFMQDIAKFVTSAYKVSGKTDQLRSDLPDTIQVCGRIIPDQVWDYLGKIKQSGNKELIIVHFQPANDEEAVAYHSFYSYLSSRKRYGVVSNYSKKIKDFYLLPLAAASPVPMVLVPFDGPGLPSPRPHLLLGVIVRHKLKQSSTTTTPKQKPMPKVEVVKTSRSYTPPHEPRSYTPPLPTSQSPDESSKPDLEVLYSPVAELTEEYKSQSLDLKFKKIKTHNSITEHSSLSPTYKSIDSNISSLVKDEDKPYDPEQDILSLTSEKKIFKTMHATTETHVKGSDHLERHKKILDLLTRQVEETDRQVNALKQLIGKPEPEDEVAMQSPNTSSIDINSVAESGMSSFLDLPENLQEILNTVRLKSGDNVRNIHEKGDVDMRIKDLFGKQLNLQTDDEVPCSLYKVSEVSKSAENNTTHSSDACSSQASTPPPIEENDKSIVSGPSDPRIKLRTSFHAQSSAPNDIPKASLSNMSASELILHAQKQFKDEKGKDFVPPLPQETKKFITVGKELSSNWSSDKEPPPPGVEARELSVLQTISDISVPSLHTLNPLVQNSTHQVTSIYPQPTNSFLTHLPHGFSVHTPPPNIQHFPPLIAPPSFPPPALQVQILPPKENKNPWPLPQHSSFESEVEKHESKLSQWDGSQDQAAQQSDSLHHSSERSNEYHNEHFCEESSSNQHWEKQQGYTRGYWNPKYQRGNRFPRRGNRAFNW